MTAGRPMLFVVQYDGGAFAGWQRQKKDRTVQADLETALMRLIGQRTPVTGAGRTDAGVHALGQAAAALIPDKWRAPDLVRALNAVLPGDVRVADARRMRAGFNPRRDATERTYCYRIGLDGGAGTPFRRRWEWALRPPFDVERAAQAAGSLAGEHGFRALSAAGQEKPHYRCTVREARWERRPDGAGWEFWISADRFLHRMVRFLVGTMVEIAQHRRAVDDLAALLDQQDNAGASPPAPPQGLFLVSVRFPAECYE